MSYIWNLPYLVQDNFLPNFQEVLSAFTELNKHCDAEVPTNSFNITVGLDGELYELDRFAPMGLIQKIHPYVLGKLLEFSKTLKCKDAKYCHYVFQITNKDRGRAIHVDMPNKVMSTIVYCAPVFSFGTFLYTTSKGDGKYQVPWKQNRILAFGRNEGSYHSYQANAFENRSALAISLLKEL